MLMYTNFPSAAAVIFSLLDRSSSNDLMFFKTYSMLKLKLFRNIRRYRMQQNSRLTRRRKRTIKTQG